MAPKLTVENVDGNHIILDIGGGAWAMYAHLVPGSMTVKPGDQVRKGDVIAKLGNTGNANAPHMHFQLMNNAIQFQADALPYVIDHLSYVGQVLPQTLAAADDYVTGTMFPTPFPAGQQRADQLPMALAVVNFPTD
jgi:murein DD-endopeptidase MepM/ murein hydrolase activator NlpD